MGDDSCEVTRECVVLQRAAGLSVGRGSWKTTINIAHWRQLGLLERDAFERDVEVHVLVHDLTEECLSILGVQRVVLAPSVTNNVERDGLCGW